MSSKVQIIVNLMAELSVTINDINDFINNPINKLIAKPNNKMLWGDLDNEEDTKEQYIKIQKITKSTKIIEETPEKVEIIENIINETIDNLVEKSIKSVIQHTPNKGWNTVVLSNVKPIVNNEVTTKPIVTKNNKLPIIHSLDEFCQMIKEKKQLFKDYLIDPKAHCSHTFNGTLCPNVYKCGKIHIQRCVYQDKCINKSCSFIHSKNMKTETAKKNFIQTMDMYKKIKQRKQVQ